MFKDRTLSSVCVRNTFGTFVYCKEYTFPILLYEVEVYLMSVTISVCLSVCLFVVYLTTLFQYLRLFSVDFYSILIRLPSSSEAGETWARNMAAEFCRRVPIVLVGFFNMP
jgi:hypothetical protein